jgi:hypothetical protein
VYDLIAVLTHKGRSADSGHYVGWVKQDDGQISMTEINCFTLLLRCWFFYLTSRKMDWIWRWQPKCTQGGRHFETIRRRWASPCRQHKNLLDHFDWQLLVWTGDWHMAYICLYKARMSESKSWGPLGWTGSIFVMLQVPRFFVLQEWCINGDSLSWKSGTVLMANFIGYVFYEIKTRTFYVIMKV